MSDPGRKHTAARSEKKGTHNSRPVNPTCPQDPPEVLPVPHDRPRSPKALPRALALLHLLYLALAAPVGAARAQSAPLEWRWDQGDATAYHLIERMDQQITGAGLDTRIRWVREVGFTDEVLAATPEGHRIRRSFEHVGVEAAPADTPAVRHDTRRPDASPEAARHPMVAPFIALAGKRIEFTVGPEGAVTDLTGADDALDAMHAALLGPLASPGLSAGLRAFSGAPGRDAALARQLEQSLRIIPGRAVRRGETWDIPVEHTTPLAGSLKSTTTATLRRVDARRGVAEIELEGTLSLSGADDAAQSPGLAALLGITLNESAITGRVTFDIDSRRIDASDLSLTTVWTIAGEQSLGADPDGAVRQTLKQRATLTRLTR
jgi:hypothetical protein